MNAGGGAQGFQEAEEEGKKGSGLRQPKGSVGVLKYLHVCLKDT